MDPNATLTLIRSSLIREDWSMLQESAQNLLVWLNCGGFPPSGMTRSEANHEAFSARERALYHIRAGETV